MTREPIKLPTFGEPADIKQQAVEHVVKLIAENRVIAFIKGSAGSPACGFSAAMLRALQESGCQFVTVDVLEDPSIRQALSSLHNWPTIPQLFIDGQLIGGSDIVSVLDQNGQLQSLLSDQ
jgi:monothiol glutaredoxin